MNQAVMELINNPDRITDALNNVEPGSKLERVMEKWENIDLSCFSFEDNKWQLEGFITFFRECHEIMNAIDPSISKTLPARCFDVEFVSRAFQIPLEDFGVQPKVAEPEQQIIRIEESAFSEMADALTRIADHITPAVTQIVGTRYVADKLGCTTTWITDLIRNNEIPATCIVEGTGNGKQWKFHARKINSWIANR